MLKYCPLASLKGENYKIASRTGWRFLITPDDLKRQMPTVLHTVKNNGYALDNGAWSAAGDVRKWNEADFWRLANEFGGKADFIVCPDVVGNKKQTFELSQRVSIDVKSTCKKVLFAVQDGMTREEVKVFIIENALNGIFVGGSTEFKIKSLPTWSELAKEMRIYLHVGRVNTAKRIKYCARYGADSFDGSGVIRFKKHMNLINAHIKGMNMQPFLC